MNNNLVLRDITTVLAESEGPDGRDGRDGRDGGGLERSTGTK